MAMLLRENYGRRERAVQKGALVWFLCFTGMYFGRLFYKWYPELYTALEPLIYACHTCSGVAFYYIVFKMTSGTKEVRFPRVHIILPLIIPAVLAVWMPFVPFEVPLGIVKGFRALNPEWPLFSRVFASVMSAEVLFVGSYLILSLLRLRRYRRSLPVSKRRNARYRLRWVYVMMTLICIAWVHPAAALATSLEATYSAWWFLAPTVIAIVGMELILLNNLQRHNYPPPEAKPKPKPKKKPVLPPVVEIPVPDVGEADANVPPPGRTAVKSMSKKDFDAYFRKEKPYLDTELKLTTLAEQLGLGREELSRFINRTYGVNFNVFIGRWRLRELESLSRLKKNRDVPLKSLFRQAGFAYYNGYLRARHEAEGWNKETEKDKNKETPQR